MSLDRLAIACTVATFEDEFVAFVQLRAWASRMEGVIGARKGRRLGIPSVMGKSK
jgi:hypothetical protein